MSGFIGYRLGCKWTEWNKFVSNAAQHLPQEEMEYNYLHSR